MADGLELLFKLKAQNEVSPVLRVTQADLARLRQSFGADFTAMQGSATRALGGITSSLTNLSGRIPIVGGAVQSLTAEVGTLASGSAVLGTGFVAMAGAIVGTTVALAAVTAGVVLAAKGIFELAKSTAEYEGNLFDLSKQTNLSTETLSGLSVAAKLSGTTLESLIPSLGIFQVNMVKAAEGGNEMSKVFERLNIDTVDQEKALRQAIKALSDMGETERQTAEAKKLFGRAGLAVLGIIKETNGNLDEAIKKYGEMNMIVGDAAAAAADAFGDRLEMLNMQFAALGRTIGEAVIPVLHVFMQDIAQALTGSAANWKGWADEVRFATAFATAGIETFVQFVASKGTLDPGVLMDVNIKSILARATGQEAIYAALAMGRASLRRFGGTRGGDGAEDDGGKAAEKAAKEAHDRAAKAIQLSEKGLEESTKDHRLALERQRSLDLKDLEEYVVEARNRAHQHWKDQIANFDQQEGLARRDIENKEDLKLKLIEIQQGRTKATNDLRREQEAIEDKARRERDESALAIERQLLAIRDARREEELDRIKASLEREEITEAESIVRRLAVEKQGYEDRQAIRDLELAQLSTSAERKIALDNEKIESEQKYTNAVERATADRIAADKRAQKAQFDLLNEAARGAERRRRATVSDGPKSPFDAFRKAVDDMDEGVKKTLAGGALDAMGMAFERIGEAVGQAVYAFVLYGNAGESVRKVTAEILASIAQMAAVQAIYELAQGLAVLALAFFGMPNAGPSASAHFAAAAMYGAIAGVTAVAGRAVAGGSFAQGGAATGTGAPGSPGGKSGTTSGTSHGPTTINAERNRIVNEIHLHGDLKDFGVRVVKTVVKNINGNGAVRAAIKKEK